MARAMREIALGSRNEIEKDPATGGGLHGADASVVDVIVSRLRGGYTLANRGTGWWLAEPYEAYTSQKIEKIPDEIVDKMMRDGVIKIELRYPTAKAILFG